MTVSVPAKFLACFFFVALTAVPATKAQTFWTEAFEDESTATSNWQHTGTNAGPSLWTWTDDPAAGNQDPDLPAFAAPTADNGYFLFNSDANGQTPHDVWLTNVNRPADCTGKSGVRFRFYTQYIYFNPAGTIAQLGVSTDSVNFTYQTLFDTLPANLPFTGWVDLDISQADNQPKVWLRFRWIGNYEYHWKVDDLGLYTINPFNPDSCETAVDITAYFGHPADSVQTTGLFDNTTATVSANDPVVTCWGEAGPGGTDILNNTMWFSFVGDGGTYDIQTVPCNATNYIGTSQGNLGDTQMLAFKGSDCSDLTEVACNDDLFTFGMPDWRAGITLETTPGQQYYLLLDGFESQGVAAVGEFCLQIAQQAAVPCAEGAVGSFDLGNSGFLCANENLSDILTLDTASFVLPTVSVEHGLAWCISQNPLSAGTWPGSVMGIFSTPFSPLIAPPDLPNDNTLVPYGTHYLTPVVLGGGTRINPNALPFVYNVNPTGGCFFVGQSRKIVLLPPLDPLSAAAQVLPEILPPGNNGSISLQVDGGSGDYLNDASQYLYQWSNGSMAKDLADLAGSTYTVTISDRSGCTGSFVLVVVVGKLVSTGDPAQVRKFDVLPNLTSGTTILTVDLKTAADVKLEVVNAAGQVLETRVFGYTERISNTLDLSRFADGTYLIRLFAGGAVAQRRVVLAR
ncbi:MAG: T9SS type A sorting domain-containing protein [Saprospiraceae bacterium]